jgi:hypothetical protein
MNFILSIMGKRGIQSHKDVDTIGEYLCDVKGTGTMQNHLIPHFGSTLLTLLSQWFSLAM